MLPVPKVYFVNHLRRNIAADSQPGEKQRGQVSLFMHFALRLKAKAEVRTQVGARTQIKAILIAIGIALTNE